MLGFDKKYHESIKEGKITLAFRFWDTLRVLRGKIYRAHNLGLLRILDVDFRKVSSITAEDARRCGFASVDDFVCELVDMSDVDIDFENDRVVRIEFEYIGEDIENYKKAMGNVKDSEIFNIKEQLIVLEQKSNTPCIRKTLQILKKNAFIQTKELETNLEIPPERVKVFMRKLKALQLVTSNNRKGYSITPLGIKLLKHLRSKEEEQAEEEEEEYSHDYIL
ncbi:MAG: hypothetical protein L3V56_10095 [Candidatus Magnetoovum sp. WYHC-5]|nr:hypothetical protein [Candidatus Magnetoovum sp. WYHC-5]